MITTATEIKHIENHIEVLNSIEVDLGIILLDEHLKGFLNDLDNSL